MAYTIPTTEPTTITAGDSLEWDVSLAAFPASEGWELSWHLASESAAGADLSIVWGTHVTADGDVFEVRVAASETGTLAAGPYRLTARATLSTVTKSWTVGRVMVLADPATVAGAKSFARTMRDSLRTAMSAAAADGAYLSVSVNGRSVTYAREAARKELAHYELMVAIEENPTGRLEHAVGFARG